MYNNIINSYRKKQSQRRGKIPFCVAESHRKHARREQRTVYLAITIVCRFMNHGLRIAIEKPPGATADGLASSTETNISRALSTCSRQQVLPPLSTNQGHIHE